jgi:hypothetical protein
LKIFFDHCVPKRLLRLLSDHEVTSYDSLAPLIPRVEDALTKLAPGDLIEIS